MLSKEVCGGKAQERRQQRSVRDCRNCLEDTLEACKLQIGKADESLRPSDRQIFVETGGEAKYGDDCP